MANPFAGLGDLFGPPAALRVEQLQQEGANQRAGMAVGEQRRQFDQTQALLQDAARTWAQITQRHTGAPIVGVTPGVQHEFSGMDMPQITMQPGSPNLQAALREFITTPQFISLGNAGVNFGNLINTLSQNPNALTEAFTLGPGQQRYGPTPPGTTPPLIAQNTNQPPGGRTGPLDQQRGQILLNWAQAGNDANETMFQLDVLENALTQSGQQQWGALWDTVRGRLGLPPGTTPRAVAEAVRTRLVRSMHGSGAGAMTDSDAQLYARALPHVGNSAEANATILEIIRRNTQTVLQRAQIAQDALTANTNEAVDQALANASNPSRMAEMTRQRERAWVANTFGVTDAELQPRTIGDFERLGRRLLATGGNSPRLTRFLRDLEAQIRRDHN